MTRAGRRWPAAAFYAGGLLCAVSVPFCGPVAAKILALGWIGLAVALHALWRRLERRHEQREMVLRVATHALRNGRMTR